MDWIYNVPIKFYEYNLDELKERLSKLKKNILFICSKRVIKTYNLEINQYQVLNESIINPDVHLVEEVLEKIDKPELIITIGGGSTIDLGKAISALYNYRNDDVLDLLKNKNYLNNNKNIPLIAIPTTAGTGSECTKWATIWDFDNSKKYSIDADYLYPKETWLVPELTSTMDKSMTLSTGLDALAHAMESYWSIHSNIYTRVLARNAIEIIREYLPLVLNNLDNIKYREQMLMGSFFAGLAFSNTRTTACHSISYPLTMKFGINHGFAVALTLFEVLNRNWDYLKEKELFLNAWNAKNLDEIEEWFNYVSNNKLHLSNFGVKRNEIPNIVKLATTSGRMDNNPIIFNKKEIESILNNIF
ncbi:phosphonate metabolism-associated iron-containing alcohol dehydrogenase [Methanobrevibacter gottschalkii]|uniref:Phosphonate metabolism-associated iron-containing alcohol dehydrogenase n=1 Tax=Methanobrevibacter gottschalkii TaxID=190974 RepID=A0A1H7NF12_9EURY|nr:phosphonoacetaldehyde reductase [Methanobrevibacter gottschalkii]SEL22152.1 phosphonate metabolism-associated iron-containing alcohol dehydrogenase [Methanobrevibacter gottschalkii]